LQKTQMAAQATSPSSPPKDRCHETIHCRRVVPADAGVGGFVDGGTLLEWIDRAAYATAVQWCDGHCVAASVGSFHLDRPIDACELVELHAALTYTGRHSMHIVVTVCAGASERGKTLQIWQCPMVFVAIDNTGDLVAVPQWKPQTILELQWHRQARTRVHMRKRIEDSVAAESYRMAGAAPCTILRFRAAFTDVDNAGNVRAGRVLRWIDEAAYVCGRDWAGGEVIASYLAGMRFSRRVLVGEPVEVSARLIHTGPRSVHIGIEVSVAGDLAAHGVVVVVSLGVRGEAQPLPQWEPVTEQDRRRDRHARYLIELRQYLEPFTVAAIFSD
jgi:4-hydroxybenzoyl-CoA thioesterase